MAPSPDDDLPVVRAGATRRLFIGGLLGLFMLELGLRILLGNYAQSSVVQPSDVADVCVEAVPGASVRYTGWLQRIAGSDLRINARGARGPAVDPRPRPGVLRVAAVGDEFTFGLGVDAEDAFVQVAGRALAREGIVNEILNFAVPGHATPQMVAQVLDKAVELRPDVVLLVVSPDDLVARQSWCVEPLRAPVLGPLLRHVYTARLAGLRLDGLRDPALPPAARAPDGSPQARFRASLLRLKEAGREHDFAVVVALLADRDAARDPAYCGDCAVAQDLVADLGVDVVDLAPVWRQLRAHRDESFVRGEGRLSVEGNLRVGLQLAQALAGWADLQGRATDRSARLRP
jgi:hypothetical protein